MNTKALHILEYDKIIEQLTERCSTPLGKKMAEELLPMTDISAIQQAQLETADAFSRLLRFGSCSCSGARDIRDSFMRLKAGASLGTSELLAIGALLKAAFRVKKYGAGDAKETPSDSLDSYFAALEPLLTFQKLLDKCIISEEEIADDASPGLASVRRKIRAAEARIHSELNALVTSNSSYLRDNMVTMRNGRYCVPVRSEFRSQVPGLVHDESGTGSTVFIEPMRIVRLNNEISELGIQEQKEIEKVLAMLSGEAAAHTPALEGDLAVLTQLDLIFAKASLARTMNGSRPEFNDKHIIRLKKARHPLLDPKKVVPINVTLGENFHQLIITGPNTGGKTVSLKTMGLLTLMGQAGLHIPASSNSSLGLFTEVYADIGDEQSIEQSLSTFSSHMVNIIRILDKADSDSLVLLDELCAGTDPNEGAALAIAILNFLRRMQVNTMATTHYSEIKLYALSTPDVENASCEFDVATLSPTYRLLVGIPGKSNAFAISQKLGLPGFIIDEAKGQIDSETERFEDIIKSLNDSRKSMEEEQQEVSALRKEAAALNETLEKEKAKIENERARILNEARASARKMLADAKDRVDETIRAVNKAGDSVSVRELEQHRTRTREMLEGYSDKDIKEKQISGTKAKDLHIGDSVKVLSMNLKGTVNTLPDQKGNLFVQCGILRSQVHVSDVVLLKEETISFGGRSFGEKKTKVNVGKAAYISAEINLIGSTVDEALHKLDKYLDDAYLAHLPSVRIVHGKGSGTLRAAVHKHLKSLRYVKSFHLGEYGEGDAGVTIAEFQ